MLVYCSVHSIASIARTASYQRMLHKLCDAHDGMLMMAAHDGMHTNHSKRQDSDAAVPHWLHCV